jgi:hypothetical protein
MKHVALLLLVLSAGWTVQAQTAEGNYLVGDGRLGPWRVGVAEQDLLTEFTSRFGGNFRLDPPLNHRLRGGGRAYFWRSAGFQFIAYEGKVVSIGIWRRYTDPAPNAELMKFKTKEGIGIGVPFSRVVSTYREPARQWEVRWAPTAVSTAMVWPSLGLYMEIRDGDVDAIGVYDPDAPWQYQ